MIVQRINKTEKSDNNNKTPNSSNKNNNTNNEKNIDSSDTQQNDNDENTNYNQTEDIQPNDNNSIQSSEQNTQTNLKTESMEIMKRLQMKVIQLVTINQTILRIKNLHLSKQRMLSMIGIKIKDLDIV